MTDDTFQIRCACGHRAPFDAFTTTAIGGDLPHDTYQCPSCSRAWRRQLGEVHPVLNYRPVQLAPVGAVL